MKILYHCYEFGAGAGGIGQYLYQMAKGISEIGVEVSVICGKKNILPDEELCKRLTIFPVYSKPEVGSEAINKYVVDTANKLKVDVIEGTDHLGECSRIISIPDRRFKVYIKYHGSQFLKVLTSAGVIYPWQRLVMAAALLRIKRQIDSEKFCVEKADAAIYPSNRIILELIKQKAELPERRELIPNMLTRLPHITNYEEAKKKTLLFVGRIEILKGIQYLPTIMNRVCEKHPDTILQIAGSDQYARGLGSLKEWLIRKLGRLANRVEFLGSLGPRDLDVAYRKCWLLIFPSKWDNFPMAVLEAMSYGKPVVTTVNGGMPEMLAGTGAFIEQPDSDSFGDAICHLLSDESLRRKIGDACRERVLANYVPNKVIPAYLQFIKSVI